MKSIITVVGDANGFLITSGGEWTANSVNAHHFRSAFARHDRVDYFVRRKIRNPRENDETVTAVVAVGVRRSFAVHSTTVANARIVDAVGKESVGFDEPKITVARTKSIRRTKNGTFAPNPIRRT